MPRSYGCAGSLVIQYGVSSSGGVLNRAFTTHRAPSVSVAVVGTSRTVRSVVVNSPVFSAWSGRPSA